MKYYNKGSLNHSYRINNTSKTSATDSLHVASIHQGFMTGMPIYYK